MDQNTFFDREGGVHIKPEEEPVYDRPSGYAFIGDGGRVLMVQPMWHPLWELPGGGIEAGEVMIAGVHREVLEETGYRVTLVEKPIYETRKRFYHIDGGDRRFCHAHIQVFVGSIIGPRHNIEAVPVGSADEIARVSWVVRRELTQQNTLRIHWPVLERLR